jgi:FdhE protein
MTRESWLEAHPYLRPLAEVSAWVDNAAAGLEVPTARLPEWDDYLPDFVAGVPLLASADAAVDLAPGGRLAAALVESLASAPSATEKPLPPPLAAEVCALAAELRRTPEPSRHVVDFLLDGEALAMQPSGSLRYLAWTAMARYLRPIVEAFASWRDEERWLRRYCPTCGSLPAMAQLVGADPGRKRLLRCGCCQTRWQFKRTACPFCEADSQKLSSVAVDGYPSLRIDHCEPCRGYLKTYDGQGDETLLLADWSSLHLDLVAHDRGLQRRAASLYDFAPVAAG